MKKIKAGVVGVGRLGKEHARIYASLPGVELAGVVDTDGSRAEDIAAQYKTDSCQDYKTLCGKVDAVSVAVPTGSHYKIARYFLENGTHVLLEKPITRTIEEAEELVELAGRNKLVLQVGHVERYNAAIRRVNEFISNPRFIESHRLSPYQPRGTEVSVVLDLMIHDLDIILHLVNSPLERIEAVGVSVLSKHEDIANVHLVFKNGCVCNVTSSRLSREKLRKIRIFQHDSYISLDYSARKIDIYRKTPDGTITHENVSPEEPEPLRLEIEDFITCLEEGKKPLVSGMEGKEVLKIALEIEKQIHKKQ